MLSLHRGHANLLCIVPILVYVFIHGGNYFVSLPPTVSFKLVVRSGDLIFSNAKVEKWILILPA